MSEASGREEHGTAPAAEAPAADAPGAEAPAERPLGPPPPGEHAAAPPAAAEHAADRKAPSSARREFLIGVGTAGVAAVGAVFATRALGGTRLPAHTSPVTFAGGLHSAGVYA